MTRRGILTIVVAVCAVSGADRALAQEALPPCAAPQTKARVDGRSPQPTEQEARQAEIACGLGAPTSVTARPPRMSTSCTSG